MALRYADTGGQRHDEVNIRIVYTFRCSAWQTKSVNRMVHPPTRDPPVLRNEHAAEDAMKPSVGFEAWPPGTRIQECHVASVMNCGLPPEW
jgi:hypothetical protein